MYSSTILFKLFKDSMHSERSFRNRTA